jgi:hypothetical protein
MEYLLINLKKRPYQYFFLFFGLLFCASAFLYFGHDPSMQRRLIYAAGGYYFLWSLYHHYTRGDLALPLIVEYLLIILFGLLLLSSTFLF